MRRTIFALDLGAKCGWASGVPGDVPTSGAWSLREPGTVPGVAYANLMQLLCDMWADDLPALVVKEAPIPLQAFQHLGNAEATVRMTLGLHAIVEGVCVRFGLQCEQFADSTIRRHFIGKGRMGTRAETKRAVVARCKLLKYLPRDCTDDNRADALACWDYAQATARTGGTGAFHLFGEAVA